MPGEHESDCDGDDHQRDVIELTRAVGAAVEDYCNAEDNPANRECDAGLDQAHARIIGPAATAL